MWQVQNDEPVGHLRVRHSKRPRDHPTPIMAHDDGFLLMKMVDNRADVRDQFFHRIVLHTDGLVAIVVTTLVDRDHLELGGQRRHLLAPGIPVIRKTMN